MFVLICDGKVKKGDVFGVVCIVVIQGVKCMVDFILLCYLFVLMCVVVDFEFDDVLLGVYCVVQVEMFGWIGVEMEVLMVVQVGLLIVYDMCKVVDCGMVIIDVSVWEKCGGKLGDWKVEDVVG